MQNWYLVGIITTAVILLITFVILMIIEGAPLLGSFEPFDDLLGSIMVWVAASLLWPVVILVGIGILGAVFDRRIKCNA